MADLTILAPVPIPLHPSLQPSRPSLFKTFVPGASSSRVNLTSSQEHLPSSIRRTRTRNGSSDTETTEDTDGFHSCSDYPDEGEGDTPLADDAQVESPTSYTYNNMQKTQWDIGYRKRKLSGTSTGIDLPPPQSLPASTSHTHLPLSLKPLSRGRTPAQHHRPTRSRSAPPFKTSFNETKDSPTTPGPFSAGLDGYNHAHRSYTTFSTYSTASSTVSSPSSSFSNPSWAIGIGNANKTKGGELLRPPPPLHRPTTFWRHNRRSGVTSSSFSPSTHVVRRSTFVAAGIPFEKPICDLSALGVESRVRTAIKEEGGSKEVSAVFWEVVVQR